MADKTGISWADSTFNPWIGCTKVSPACDNCYAERDFDKRRHVVSWGPGNPRKRTSAANWKNPVRWNAKPFYECEHCGWRGEDDAESSRLCICQHCGTRLTPARRRVFSASLADWLDNEIPVEWFVDLLDLIRRTPNLDWLLLSKRIGNWRHRLEASRDFIAERLSAEDPETDALFDFVVGWLEEAAPKNVWLGISVCNQAEADRDIPKLLAVPAGVRFLSIEPMLGPIALTGHEYSLALGLGEGIDWLTGRTTQHSDIFGGSTMPWLDRDIYDFPQDAQEPRIHWVICGGESGPKARPMHPHWPRSLRDQCAEAGVPFLFKQHGEWIGVPDLRNLSDGSGPGFGAFDHCPHDKGNDAVRIGVKAAGRLLDGIEHNGFPEGAEA